MRCDLVRQPPPPAHRLVTGMAEDVEIEGLGRNACTSAAAGVEKHAQTTKNDRSATLGIVILDNSRLRYCRA